MVYGSFAAGGTGVLHKTDGIKRKEPNVEMLKTHLKISGRRLKLDHRLILQMGPKHSYKFVKSGKC